MTEICQTCRFARADGAGLRTTGLECRRMPPPWYAVGPEDWCGMWVYDPGIAVPSKLRGSSPGRRAGGLARAASMSPAQRKEIAQRAARKRWDTK